MFISGSQAVEPHFQQNIPDTLWHYTNKEAFEGILNSRCLWATEIHCLNDQEEFVHWRRYADEYLHSEKFKSFQQMLRSSAPNLIETILTSRTFSSDRLEVFVLCFSKQKDSRTQWGLYADNSRGVSLGLDTRNLRVPYGVDSAVRFGPCIYEDAEKRHLFRGAIDSASANLHALNRAVKSKDWIRWRFRNEFAVAKIYGTVFKPDVLEAIRADTNRLITTFVTDIFSLATHCKHAAFADEREWRLTLPRAKATKPREGLRYVRQKGSEEIPYVKLHFQRDFLELRSVMLAPCNYSSIESVEQQLRKNSFACSAVRSEIPLVC